MVSLFFLFFFVIVNLKSDSNHIAVVDVCVRRDDLPCFEMLEIMAAILTGGFPRTRARGTGPRPLVTTVVCNAFFFFFFFFLKKEMNGAPSADSEKRTLLTERRPTFQSFLTL